MSQGSTSVADYVKTEERYRGDAGCGKLTQ